MGLERCKSDRELPIIAASCRVRGDSYAVRLSALSHSGCRAELAKGGVRPGEQVVLEMGRLLVVPAVVLGVSGRRAELKFASPLHGAMASEYARRQARPEGKA